jgi:hypothetical protein
MKAVSTFTAWLKVRFPHAVERLRQMRGGLRRERERWHGKSNEEIFSAIYDENLWASDESRSGKGSTLQATASIRLELPRVLERLGADSMLDAPCGDFNWMKEIRLPIARYIGADIVPKLIENLQKQYGDTTRSFIHLDITKGPLPGADVFFCRDCLLHLSNATVHAVLENFRRSSCKHLITSNYPDVQFNPDVFTGGVRPLNLQLPPFNLPKPLHVIDDPGENVLKRVMGVWSREQLTA